MGYHPKPYHKNRIEQKKNGDDNLLVKIYKSASNTNRANLTWLPSEIMHRGHT